MVRSREQLLVDYLYGDTGCWQDGSWSGANLLHSLICSVHLQPTAGWWWNMEKIGVLLLHWEDCRQAEIIQSLHRVTNFLWNHESCQRALWQDAEICFETDLQMSLKERTEVYLQWDLTWRLRFVIVLKENTHTQEPEAVFANYWHEDSQGGKQNWEVLPLHPGTCSALQHRWTCRPPT